MLEPSHSTLCAQQSPSGRGHGERSAQRSTEQSPHTRQPRSGLSSLNPSVSLVVPAKTHMRPSVSCLGSVLHPFGADSLDLHAHICRLPWSKWRHSINNTLTSEGRSQPSDVGLTSRFLWEVGPRGRLSSASNAKCSETDRSYYQSVDRPPTLNPTYLWDSTIRRYCRLVHGAVLATRA